MKLKEISFGSPVLECIFQSEAGLDVQYELTWHVGNKEVVKKSLTGIRPQTEASETYKFRAHSLHEGVSNL